MTRALEQATHLTRTKPDMSVHGTDISPERPCTPFTDVDNVCGDPDIPACPMTRLWPFVVEPADMDDDVIKPASLAMSRPAIDQTHP